MLAGILIVPMFILTVVLGLLALTENLPVEIRWIGVLPFSIGVGLFIIRQGINEWWYSKYPPGLAQLEKDIIARCCSYYIKLNKENKRIFEERVSVFRLQKKFQMRGADKIPGDIQLLLSASAVQLTMGFENQKEFFEELGMIVLFPKLFITPDINTQLHAVELNQDKYDCLLFSVKPFVDGLMRPTEHYHTGLHGMAKAFKLANNITDKQVPCEEPKELLVKLHHLRGFQLGYQFQYTGLGDMEVFEMCTEHFFQCPERLQETLPDVYQYMMDIYQQDPSNRLNPIIQQNIEDKSEEISTT